MILDDEIEEMGGLFFDAGVEVITVEGLMDGTENAGQTCTSFLAEQFGGLADGGKFIAEAINALTGEREIERDCCGRSSGFWKRGAGLHQTGSSNCQLSS